MHWSDHIDFAIALFALLNPFTKIPFVVVTASRDGPRAVLVLAVTSTLTAMVVLLLAHLLGEGILEVLGTSLPSFQIGGGLVILLTGLHMLTDQGVERTLNDQTVPSEDTRFVTVGVSPLGIPMLAGSAAITKVIIETHLGGAEADIHIVSFIVIVCLLAGLVIAASSVLMRLLGRTFFAVIARIAGLIIVAIGVELIAKGVAAHAHLILG